MCPTPNDDAGLTRLGKPETPGFCKFRAAARPASDNPGRFNRYLWKLPDGTGGAGTNDLYYADPPEPRISR